MLQQFVPPMEPGINLLSSSSSSPFLSRTHPRSFLRSCSSSPSSSSSCSSSSSSVLVFHEHTSPAVTSIPTRATARHIRTSALLQEQRNEFRPKLNIFKEDKSSQVTLRRRHIENGFSIDNEQNPGDYDQLVWDLKRQLMQWPDLSWSYLETADYASSCLDMPSIMNGGENLLDVKPDNAIALAKKALSASKQAASLAEESKLTAADLDDSLTQELQHEKRRTVKSTRLQERRSKRRRVKEQNFTVNEHRSPRREYIKRKFSEGYDPNDPLRLFLWGPETKQLLTIEEESELIIQIQDLIRLEAVKTRLESQFGREPTLVEWAEVVGLDCRKIKMQLHCGRMSRQKLIYANLRMVVHIAKQYQGRGLILQDLLQEGSMGLMKSIEKFKPQAGCRFPTYAYWWIRQTIRKALFQHSRTIRLPENVYSLLGKVKEAKKLHVGEGNHNPTKEDLARSVGITVEKLDKLLYISRTPLSMQQPVWADQETTFQEITADTGVEIPGVSVEKDLMRRHVRNLLGVLNPKERRIIRLRYGIEDGKEKTLLEIGNMFGLSKERVRQLENRALFKLKRCCSSHGLGAYSNLLV